MKKLLGLALGILAVGYPVALLLIVLAFRLIGERSWPVTAVLYLPRAGFALPLPFLTLAVLLARRRRLLMAQGVAALLLLFPLMGLRLRLPGSPRPTAGAARIRLVSYNIDSGGHGARAILAQLQEAAADLILLQETSGREDAILRAGLAGYWFHASGQFWLASRYPIEEVVEPPRIQQGGKARSPRFVRYRLATPAGPIQVYNVHPISPRDALEDLRGEGLRSQVSSGRIWNGVAAAGLAANTALRVAQVQAIAEDAARSPYPVIIAGDTNLPGLSWALGHWLGGYRDGFAEVGSGLGYTFPAPKRPWMRIDRVLVGPPFRFLAFAVRPARVSDHLAVSAELELPRP